MNSKKFSSYFLRIESLLALGAVFHILFTVCVFLAGRYRFVPNWILPNGNLPEDPARNLAKIVSMSGELYSGSLRPILSAAEPIDQRLYTISNYLTSGLLGNNILSIELLNVLIFSAILFLVCRIGSTLFDYKVGIFSGYAVMFFPSLILHTTQPLRDPLFLAVFLLFVFLIVTLFRKPLELPKASIWLCKSALVFLMLWLVRDRFYFVYLAVISAALFLMVVESLRNKGQFKFNAAVLLLVLSLAIITPFAFSPYISKKAGFSPSVKVTMSEWAEKQDALDQPAILAKINKMRYGFLKEYSSAGSNIDTNVIFEDLPALFAYLPRALSIGLFSPFPNDWLGSGEQYGKTGKLLAGVETAFVYMLLLPATIAVIRKKSIAAFFVTSTILAGTIALGLVVPNIGALYRMRYVYWLLIICLGIGGVFELKKLFLMRLERHKSSGELAISTH